MTSGSCNNAICRLKRWPNWSQQPVRLIPARSHAPRDPLQAIHCAVEGMDAKRSAAVLLSSSAAAQRCAEGAGLDSGTVAAAQSAMPSIAARGRTDCKQYFHWCRRIRRPSATIPNLHQLDGRDHEEIATLSPLRLPGVSKPLAITYGTAELPALVRNSREYHAHRAQSHQPGSLIPIPNANHYTGMEELRSPNGILTRSAVRLIEDLS